MSLGLGPGQFVIEVEMRRDRERDRVNAEGKRIRSPDSFFFGALNGPQGESAAVHGVLFFCLGIQVVLVCCSDGTAGFLGMGFRRFFEERRGSAEAS